MKEYKIGDHVCTLVNGCTMNGVITGKHGSADYYAIDLQNGEVIYRYGEDITPEEEAFAAMINATNTVKQMSIEALYAPEVCQRVTLVIDGDYGSDNEKTVFEAIRTGHTTICMDLVTRYAESHGIKWGGIWGCKADHYDHGKNKRGHYIVSGYISGRIGYEIDFMSNCADVLRQRAEQFEERRGA